MTLFPYTTLFRSNISYGGASSDSDKDEKERIVAKRGKVLFVRSNVEFLYMLQSESNL